MPHCSLSIVVPCYNSAATLVPLVERIAAALTSRSDTHEVLLVNDGSPDPETWSVMERLAGRFNSVRAFDLAGNRGQTAATLYGMSQARSDIVVTMDADLQHPPEEIARLIEPLRRDSGIDCVIGAYRFRRHSLLRKLGSRVVGALLWRCFGKPAGIRATSFRALRRDAADRLCHERDVPPLLGAMIFRTGMSVVNVEVKHDPRPGGGSSYSRAGLVRLAMRTASALRVAGDDPGAGDCTLRAYRGRRVALILGVAAAQVDAIRYLQHHGWWVVGCSYQREGPGLKLVDHFELVDVRDQEAIVDLAQRMGADFIYSIGSDIAMPVATEVSARLGLPSLVAAATASLMHDKLRLRAFLNANDLGCVRYRAVRSRDDVAGWDMFPAVLKPCDSQGQRGVFRCDTPQDVFDHLEESLCHSPSGTLILEEFLDGPEVSAHAFVVDGQMRFVSVADRSVVEDQPGGIPSGHVLPSRRCIEGDLSLTEQLIHMCVAALGITSGPVYFQLKLTDAGPRVIEIAPRLDGCHLWRLIQLVYGVDLLGATFALLAGETPQLPHSVCPVTDPMQIHYRLSPPHQPFWRTKHRDLDHQIYAEDYYTEGETVRPVNHYLERVGYSVGNWAPTQVIEQKRGHVCEFPEPTRVRLHDALLRPHGRPSDRT